MGVLLGFVLCSPVDPQFVVNATPVTNSFTATCHVGKFKARSKVSSTVATTTTPVMVPSVAVTPPVVQYTFPAVTSDCPNGVCIPAPTLRRFGIFRR